jgi:hypothetical protein
METLYHLAGSDVSREENVLRRQRRYRRGTITDGASSKVGSRRGRRRTDAIFGVGGDSTVSDGEDDAATATTTTSALRNNRHSSMSLTATTGVVTTVDSATFDDMLVDAFRSMIYLPPSMPGTIGTGLLSPDDSASLQNVDVASRRRLDRRTLYHGLMAKLGGAASHGGQRANDNDDDDDDGANGGGRRQEEDEEERQLHRYHDKAEIPGPLRAPTSVDAASVIGAAVTETQGLQTDPGAVR